MIIMCIQTSAYSNPTKNASYEINELNKNVTKVPSATEKTFRFKKSAPGQKKSYPRRPRSMERLLMKIFSYNYLILNIY